MMYRILGRLPVVCAVASRFIKLTAPARAVLSKKLRLDDFITLPLSSVESREPWPCLDPSPRRCYDEKLLATGPAMTPTLSRSTPTHARYWVIVFAVSLAILSYIDRVCISQAAPVISRDLGLSKADMGKVFGAFALAYALFEIPGGWLGDLMGPRKVL